SHHEAEGEDHEHDDFESTVMEIPELGADPGAANALVTKLMALSETHDILRVKGFLAVVGKPMRLTVQGVGARFRQTYDRAWAPGEKRSSHLVFIARKGLNREAIGQALAA
ncbi:MAG: cobalamin biosynthesis protein CobW, partial [Burkholderiales bacterium]